MPLTDRTWKNKCTTDWMNELLAGWLIQWVHEWMNARGDDRVKEYSKSTTESNNARWQWMNAWKNEEINAWSSERTNEWLSESMSGSMNKWMKKGPKDRRTEGTKEPMNERNEMKRSEVKRNRMKWHERKWTNEREN